MRDYMRSMVLISRLTWREARRRLITYAALLLGAVMIALYSLAFYFSVRDMQTYLHGRPIYLDTGFNFMIMAGFYAVSFMSVALGVLTSVSLLPGEISSHTVQSLAAKPIRRSAIVLGKWMGMSVLLTTYVVFLCAGIALSTRLISGYSPAHLVEGVALIVLETEIMLTIGLVVGTGLGTLATGVVGFMLYGLAFLGGWVERIGSTLRNQSMMDMGVVSSLLVPSDAMWARAAFRMQSPTLTSLGLSPFSSSTPPSVAMLIYALVYVLAGLVIAVRLFNTRDL